MEGSASLTICSPTVPTEISELLEGLPLNIAQTFMVPRGLFFMPLMMTISLR